MRLSICIGKTDMLKVCTKTLQKCACVCVCVCACVCVCVRARANMCASICISMYKYAPVHLH